MSHFQDRSSGMIGESKPGGLDLSIFGVFYAEVNSLRFEASETDDTSAQAMVVESFKQASLVIDQQIQGKKIELRRLEPAYQEYLELDHAFKSAVLALAEDIEAKLNQSLVKLDQYDATHAEALATNAEVELDRRRCIELKRDVDQQNAERIAHIHREAREAYRSQIATLDGDISVAESTLSGLRLDLSFENGKKVVAEKADSAGRAVKAWATNIVGMAKKKPATVPVEVDKMAPEGAAGSSARQVVLEGLQAQITTCANTVAQLRDQKARLETEINEEIRKAIEEVPVYEEQAAQSKLAEIKKLQLGIDAKREALKSNPHYIELSKKFEGLSVEERGVALAQLRETLSRESQLYLELRALKQYASREEEVSSNFESFSLVKFPLLQDQGLVEAGHERVASIFRAQAMLIAKFSADDDQDFRPFAKALNLKTEFERLSESLRALEDDCSRVDAAVQKETLSLKDLAAAKQDSFHKQLINFYTNLFSLRARLVSEYPDSEKDFPEVTVPKTHRKLLQRDQNYLSSYHPADKANEALQLLDQLNDQAPKAYLAKLEAEAAAAELARVQAEADARAREEREVAERVARIAAHERVPSSRTLSDAARDGMVVAAQALAASPVRQSPWQKVVAFLAWCLSCFTCCVKSSAAVAPQSQDSTVVYRPGKPEVSSRASSVASYDSRLSS